MFNRSSNSFCDPYSDGRFMNGILASIAFYFFLLLGQCSCGFADDSSSCSPSSVSSQQQIQSSSNSVTGASALEQNETTTANPDATNALITPLAIDPLIETAALITGPLMFGLPGDKLSPEDSSEKVDTNGDGVPDREISVDTKTDENGTKERSTVEKDASGAIVKTKSEKQHTDGSWEKEEREVGADGKVTAHGEKSYGEDGDVKETWKAEADKDGEHIERTITGKNSKEDQTEDRDNNGNTKFRSERTDNLGTTVRTSQQDDNGNGTSTLVTTNKDGSQEGWTQVQEPAADGNVRVTTTYLDGRQDVQVGPPRSDKD